MTMSHSFLRAAQCVGLPLHYLFAPIGLSSTEGAASTPD